MPFHAEYLMYDIVKTYLISFHPRDESMKFSLQSAVFLLPQNLAFCKA